METNNQENTKKPNIPLLTGINDINNTWEDWNVLFGTGEAGIDTVCLSIPIDLNSVEQESSLFNNEGFDSFRDSGKIRHKLVGNLKKDFANIHIEVYPERESMRLRFNAARLIAPKSRILLPPGALVPLVEGILNDLHGTVMPAFDSVDNDTGELVRQVDWQQHVSITRLDVARNFTIDDPIQMRKALVAAEPKYSKLNHLYWSNDGSWTLQSCTKYSGMDRFYDKSVELANAEVDESFHCEEGTYRFEAELKGDRLRTFGLKALDQVSNARVARALEARWEALNWGVTIPEPNSLLTAIAGETLRSQDALVGYMFRASLDQLADYSKDQLAQLRKKALFMGLNPGMPFDEVGVAKRKLDLIAGGFIDVTPDTHDEKPSDV